MRLRLRRGWRVVLVLPVLAASLPSTADVGATPSMVVVAPGTYVMGSPDHEPGSRVDEVRHPVTITRPFLLAATEVTRRQWRDVMQSDPGRYPACDDCAVADVSWHDAVSFCNALSRREGLTPAYEIAGDAVTWRRDAGGYRLPTEAEWEYACRAGSTGPFGGGACLSAGDANYDGYHPPPGCPEGLNRGEPVEVGSFPPNPWGLHDMAGNVSEWCWDRYGDYPVEGAVDPNGPAEGERRVVRGGCWANFAAKCRAANRERQDPDGRWDMIGLRLARSLPDAGSPR